MTYEEIIRRVALECNVSEEIVNKTIKAYWYSIKDIALGLPLKDDITEEEFNSLRTNFNIPSLGKLCCTLERYLNMRKRFKYIQKLRKDNVQDKED